VLAGDHAPELPKLPPGSYPAWSLRTAYQAGTEVLFGGLPYESKWDNQGVSPAGQAADPDGSPWTPMFTIPGEPRG
jgi:chitinase